MTAQVAVMNKLGIALATDSAVTVSTVSSDSEKTDKIYLSSDKLFRLSDVAPVAIMTSGEANFLGMPWETVVKLYREQLGEKTFPKLSGYAKDFFRFVCANTKMFPQSVRDAFVRQLIINLLRDVQQSSYKTDVSDSGSVASMSSIIRHVVDQSLEETKKSPRIVGFGPAMDRTLRAKYGRLIAQERGSIFKGHRLSVPTKRALDDLVIESIVREIFGFMETGIVFAGFGEDEYMPVCLECEVEGMVQNKLRYSLDETQVSWQFPSWIDYFGQTDEVETFLDGVSPGFRSYMKKEIDNFVVDVIHAFERESGQKLNSRQSQNLLSILNKKWDDLWEKWDQGENKSWSPIYNMVESQPKDELAATAEMLVNLAKFRLHVNPEEETVGGPTDVAIITKGDGFVWVKKKQYYPAELNPHKTGRGAAG